MSELCKCMLWCADAVEKQACHVSNCNLRPRHRGAVSFPNEFIQELLQTSAPNVVMSFWKRTALFWVFVCRHAYQQSESITDKSSTPLRPKDTQVLMCAVLRSWMQIKVIWKKSSSNNLVNILGKKMNERKNAVNKVSVTCRDGLAFPSLMLWQAAVDWRIRTLKETFAIPRSPSLWMKIFVIPMSHLSCMRKTFVRISEKEITEGYYWINTSGEGSWFQDQTLLNPVLKKPPLVGFHLCSFFVPPCVITGGTRKRWDGKTVTLQLPLFGVYLHPLDATTLRLTIL